MTSKIFLSTLFTIIAFSITAQDLSGTWQGLEFNPGASTSEAWPSLLTIQKSSKKISASLYQCAGKNKNVFVTYAMDGTFRNGRDMTLIHKSVLGDGDGGYLWCLGTMKLKYIESQEKLVGISEYPAPGCPGGTIELYRIKLKSKNTFCKGDDVALEVTGKQVRWYTDQNLRKLIGSGNRFQPDISKTTTFYVTQTYYGIESPAVPITIKIQNPVINDIVTTKPAPGESNGEAKVTGKGRKPLSYQLNNGTFQKEPLFKNLAKGRYNMVIKDRDGCLASTTFTLAEDLEKVVAPVVTTPEANKSIILKNVFFVLTKSALQPESYAALDNLAEMMLQKPTIKIQLEGHTDRGSDFDADLKLSIERVEVVKDYLVQKGVVPERITCKGFGNEKLLYPSPNQENRRVEFVIIGD